MLTSFYENKQITSQVLYCKFWNFLFGCKWTWAKTYFKKVTTHLETFGLVQGFIALLNGGAAVAFGQTFSYQWIDIFYLNKR